MEKMILSLKSIYMLLMTDDFPIYSESVISKADRKGQTLLTLYAAAGEAMDDGAMAVLRGEGYSIEKLWRPYRREQEHSQSVVFLTVHSSMLQDSLLPRDRYSAAFLRENFPEVTGKAFQESAGEDFLEEGVAALAAGGWLEEDGSGYAMHPLIAQCLRRRIHTEERLEPVIGHIRIRLLRLLQEADQIAPSELLNEELQHICHIFLSVCRFLSGNISRELMLAVLSALCLVYPVKQEAEEYQCWLEELMKRCPERDDQTEVLLCTVLGRLDRGDITQFARVYYRQKGRLTVPRLLFLDFCIHAGGCLAHRREFDLAEQMLREGLCDAASPRQKADAYYRLYWLCERQGNWEGQLRWAREGEEYVTAHPECGEDFIFLILCMRWYVAIKYGQREAAEALKEKIQSFQLEDSIGVLKISYENIAGTYELTFGSEEQALAHYSRCLAHYLLYQGKNVNYLIPTVSGLFIQI